MCSVVFLESKVDLIYMCSEITRLKIQPYLAGTNVLKSGGTVWLEWNYLSITFNSNSITNKHTNTMVTEILSSISFKWKANIILYSVISLTHWDWVTHLCICKLTIIGSNNGLLPGRHQAIIWTNDGILLIGPLGTNFSEISIAILTSSFKNMFLEVLSAKWRPFCLSLNVLKMLLTHCPPVTHICVSELGHYWFR